MQDISQMSFGTQPQQNQPQKKTGGKRTRLAAVIAAVECGVIVVLAVLLVMMQISKSGKGQTAVEVGEEAQKHVKQTVEIFNKALHGSISPEDIRWEDYYPDEVADLMYASMEDVAEYMDESETLGITMDVLSISRVEGGAEAYMQNVARMFFGALSDEFSDVDVNFDESAIHAEEGYLALCRILDEDEAQYGILLVLKVNGKYGLYGMYADPNS